MNGPAASRPAAARATCADPVKSARARVQRVEQRRAACTRGTRTRSVAARLRRVVAHGVGQAADGVDDRHGAVAQAVHLVQPARLEPRRHQEDVGARLDQVRQRLVEADARADPIGMRARPAPARGPGSAPRRCRARRSVASSARQVVGERRDQVEALSDRPSARSCR